MPLSSFQSTGALIQSLNFTYNNINDELRHSKTGSLLGCTACESVNFDLMGKEKDVLETPKGRILTYLECGKTPKETARLCDVSQQTVIRISRNFTVF